MLGIGLPPIELLCVEPVNVWLERVLLRASGKGRVFSLLWVRC